MFSSSCLQAQRLRVGDALLSSEKILEISASRCIGLIAPVTAAGTLLVDGVATSDCNLPSHCMLLVCESRAWHIGADNHSKRHNTLCYFFSEQNRNTLTTERHSHIGIHTLIR